MQQGLDTEQVQAFAGKLFGMYRDGILQIIQS